MFKYVSSAEFLYLIKTMDERLANVKLSTVKVNKEEKEITYEFICDKSIDLELKQKILKRAEELSPKAFLKVNVTVRKIVSNPELVGVEIYRYITANYPSLSVFLKPTDVVTSVMGDVVKYVLRLTEDGIDYAKSCGLTKKLNDYLGLKFCSEFTGGYDQKEQEETPSLLIDEVYESQVQKIEHRTIKVEDMIAIDDIAMENLAVYIEDAMSGDVTVCGKITEITERETKNGKPFFIIHLNDTTGNISGVYFSKKNTLAKIRELKVDDEIIARGKIGEYNGRTSFTYEKINRCTFPKDFVKKDRYKKTAPKDYKLIFPSPVSSIKVDNVFDRELKIPQEVLDNHYVVFDLETTGLDVMNNGIIEIGAVRILNGKLVEQFSTLVKPDYPITEETTDITGITQQMLDKAPKISMVIPDFMKFIEGSILVAHNAEFDLKFIKKFAGAEEYEIKNRVEDTLVLARSVLKGLKHHDLHTIGDYFGVVFNHHRALDDAKATAEIFLELKKREK